MKQHIVELRFGIWGFEDITHEKLTMLIGVEPVRKYFKGQLVNKKLPNGKISEENGWVMASPESIHKENFEIQMNHFLKLAKTHIDLFNKLCSKYHCEFSCAIFLDSESSDNMPWIHLGDEYNSLFGKWNVHFDFDIYK
jgi:hypothetical protein